MLPCTNKPGDKHPIENEERLGRPKKPFDPLKVEFLTTKHGCYAALTVRD